MNKNAEAMAPAKEYVETFRHLVMPGDLNPSGYLFGGQMAKWMDHAAALYVMCQLDDQNIVTADLKVTFKKGVASGDFLSFRASTVKVGTSSLTVRIDVYKKQIGQADLMYPEPDVHVAIGDLVFVQMNEWGKPCPHRLSPKASVG